MTETYMAVFDILKSILFSQSEINAEYSIQQWQAIYDEMCAQAVESLLYTWLKTHSLPDPELHQIWNQRCLKSLRGTIRIMYGQDELLKLLEEHQIPCVILKGSAAAMAYPVPSLRLSGDVDFLVKRNDFDRADEVLEANGYRIKNKKDQAKYHYAYRKDGILYELHRRLCIVSEKDEEILSMFEKGIDSRQYHTAPDHTFPILPPDLNGLVLLFHINQHLRSGLGLRQIIDWMMYVEDNKGIEPLRPILKKTEMETLANTVTVMCQKYLGLKEYVKDSGDYAVDELMEYIMNKGSFGAKSGIKGKTESVFLRKLSIAEVFRRLQSDGLSGWKAAQKHPYLRPFAWVYQAGRVSGQLFANHITPSQMLKYRSIGLQQRKLIYRLGLDVDRIIDFEEND